MLKQIGSYMLQEVIRIFMIMGIFERPPDVNEVL
jgi:hypothetical protein